MGKSFILKMENRGGGGLYLGSFSEKSGELEIFREGRGVGGGE